MYMMAFVTVMVALIGLYAQIYVKIAANSFKQQSGVVETMRVWHDVAVKLGTNAVKTDIRDIADPTGPYCSLTQIAAGVGVPAQMNTRCSDLYIEVGDGSTCPGSNPVCLPPGYNETYTYYSIAFSVTAASKTSYYVLTFIPPPTNLDSYGAGILCLPGVLSGAPTTCPHSTVHTTFNAFYKELTKSKTIPILSYGTVSGTCTMPAALPASKCLKTQSVTHDAGSTMPNGAIEYEIPDTDDIPDGSIGIITDFTPKN